MNRRHHVLNAAVLGVAIGILMEPGGGRATLLSAVGVGVPVVVGALVPDVDVELGAHRKTLHNLPVLAGFVAFPLVFGNLRYVWIGVAAHYVLDLVATRRGIALCYPLWSREFALPTGVTSGSRAAPAVTLFVTLFELFAMIAVSGVVRGSGLPISG